MCSAHCICWQPHVLTLQLVLSAGSNAGLGLGQPRLLQSCDTSALRAVHASEGLDSRLLDIITSCNSPLTRCNSPVADRHPAALHGLGLRIYLSVLLACNIKELK